MEEVEIVKDLPPEEIWVMGHMAQLEQVFLNILSNALNAMGGSQPRRLSVSAEKDPESVVINVRDTGPGLPDEFFERMFDPFFTTKEAGKGLGLGLSISLSIVKGFGGTIHASNHKDGGALFTVAFPRLVSPGRAEE
ncbi:MAG: GHKL domain-containing protein [Nitrospinae bacterium]|nr:GHKL domain-containing protein [Nitrospinota bacterium]